MRPPRPETLRQEWEEPVRVRETAGAAWADIQTVLRPIEAGKVRVTDKKLVPTEAARQTVADLLAGGDFYTPDESGESKYDPSFAWPVLVQTGGLAEKSVDALKLTAAGKKALTAPPPDVRRKPWAAWLKTRAHNEFARVEAVIAGGRPG